jgi:organic radical activating enzyme
MRLGVKRLAPCSAACGGCGTAYAIKRAYFFLGRKTFMASIIDRRVTAQIEGDFVVFLIGMRINKPLSRISGY